MIKITKCMSYVAPKVKIAPLMCNMGFAQSYINGGSEISDWLNGGEDEGDE